MGQWWGENCVHLACNTDGLDGDAQRETLDRAGSALALLAEPVNQDETLRAVTFDTLQPLRTQINQRISARSFAKFLCQPRLRHLFIIEQSETSVDTWPSASEDSTCKALSAMFCRAPILRQGARILPASCLQSLHLQLFCQPF